MKLLLDQNLAPRLARELQSRYPGTVHVRDVGLRNAPDQQLWKFAATEGFTILSKDSDFHQLSFLLGPPPKVIWLRLGNASTKRILEAFVASLERIAVFEADDDAALLVLP